MGVRLQPDKNLTIETVKKAIDSILTNSSYRDRSQEFSVISKTYRGHQLACAHTVNFIKENEDKTATLLTMDRDEESMLVSSSKAKFSSGRKHNRNGHL